jgi:hypothetical protein
LIALLKAIFEIFYEGCNRDVTIQVRVKLSKSCVAEIEPFSALALRQRQKSISYINGLIELIR